ncbi:MAG: hypothetical protein V1800_05440, partial [Candidatus Latescibacterota bacterium]
NGIKRHSSLLLLGLIKPAFRALMYNGKGGVCQEESLQWIDLFAKGSRMTDVQSLRSNFRHLLKCMERLFAQ